MGPRGSFSSLWGPAGSATFRAQCQSEGPMDPRGAKGGLFGGVVFPFWDRISRELAPESVPKWGRGVPFRGRRGSAGSANFGKHRQSEGPMDPRGAKEVLFGGVLFPFWGRTSRDLGPQCVPKWGRGVPFRHSEGPAGSATFRAHRQTEGPMDPRGAKEVLFGDVVVPFWDRTSRDLGPQCVPKWGRGVWNIFVKNPCFFVNAKDTWILFDFHENPRVLDGNEKTCIFDHFPKGVHHQKWRVPNSSFLGSFFIGNGDMQTSERIEL